MLPYREFDVLPPTPCNQQDSELWFSTRKQDKARAKALCHDCMQRLDCLEDALEMESMLGVSIHGIHGGLDPKQRVGLQVRRLTEIIHPTEEGAA